MEHVNEGATATEKLLFYLEDYFEIDAVNMRGTGFYDEIVYLENHKGNWRIGFKTIPSQPLLLAICALFDTKMSYDGIEEIIFHYNTPLANSVKEVAGCLGTTDGVLRVLNVYKRLLATSVN